MEKKVEPGAGISSLSAGNRTARTSELEYLADILPQLRRMALGLDEKTLAYLLEVAMLEAHLVLDIDLKSPTVRIVPERTQ